MSVEAYDPAKGAWSKLPNMLTPRARFGAAALRGRLYAIGGSNGARDLDSVHYLSFESLKWKTAAPLKAARSSVGELTGVKSRCTLSLRRAVTYVWLLTCIVIFCCVCFVHFVVPMGISPMGNLGCFPQGKPAATVVLPNPNYL